MASFGNGTPTPVPTSCHPGGRGLPPDAGRDDLQRMDVPGRGVWYQCGLPVLRLGPIHVQTSRDAQCPELDQL